MAANVVQPSARAEFDEARVVVVHEPGAELFSALLWPEESSFEASFDSEKARSEHRAFCEQLEQAGLDVVHLRDLLRQREDLRALAHQVLVDARVALPESAAPGDAELSEILTHLGADDLVRVILERPVLNVEERGTFEVELRTRPLSNLYFMRDPVITTDRGVVLGRFAREVRLPELDVVRTALETLGIEPLYAIKPPGVLEGGDFIPHGPWALIGVGARTNQDAVDQLLRAPGAEALGYPHIAVIKDPETTTRGASKRCISTPIL
jgi:arginine deiminase